MQKNYVDHAVRENILATIGPVLHTKNVVLRGQELLEEDAVRSSGLVHALDKSGAVNFFAGIQGRYGSGRKQMDVTSCDITVAEHQEGTRVSARILCGNWIHITFPDTVRYRFLCRNGKIQNLSGESTEGTGEKKAAEAGVQTGLPKRFFLQLEELERYTTGELSLAVSGDHADVFLKDRFLAAGFRAGNEITRQMLEKDPLPELVKLLDLMQILM